MLLTPKRIAVDMDEVLFPLLRPMMKHYGVHPHRLERFSYDFALVLDKSREEAQNMLYDYYETRQFKCTKPILQSRESLKKLSERGTKLYVVTGRQEVVRDQTEEWLDFWYPGVFTDVILTDSYTPNEVPKPKVVTDLNADCIIDDSYATCMDCLKIGVPVINFIGYPPYPWCHYSSHSARTWWEVEKKLGI